MPTVVAQLEAAFRAAIKAAFDIEADPLVAASQNEKFADYQANAAMSLSKRLKGRGNPREIAQQIQSKLELGEMASEVSIAGPGFINIRLSPSWLAQQINKISDDPRLGVDKTPNPQTVVVDYSGPNIAKQMHVGHLRSTIIGDAIARVLSFRGDNVIRQNHIGDWGTQFGRVVLAMWYEAVFERTQQHDKLDSLVERQQVASKAKDKAALGAVVHELGDLHQELFDLDRDGSRFFLPYLKENSLDLDELERVYAFVSAVTDTEEAKQVSIRHQDDRRTLAELPRLVTRFIQNPEVPENQQERLAWEKAREVTRASCNEIYRRLAVQLADASIQKEPMERGESYYNPQLPAVVEDLTKLGLAKESEGATVVVVPGSENPLIIQKADRGFLYGTTDLAAVRFRVSKLGAQRIIYLVDSRQSQHFSQVFWTTQQAGWAKDISLEHAAFGTMLGPDGKPFKSRSGDTVKLKDLLDEADQRGTLMVTQKNPELPEAQRNAIGHAVGAGAMKYADLSKDRTSDYLFSFDAMLSLDGNTAPYLQYAYARIKSIFRKSGAGLPTSVGVSLESPYEISIAKHVLRFGEVIELVARELKPHHLTTYLYELATKFSSFYENCPVLQSDEPTRSSRLLLCHVTAQTLALGLDLLGIEHPEQM